MDDSDCVIDLTWDSDLEDRLKSTAKHKSIVIDDDEEVQPSVKRPKVTAEPHQNDGSTASPKAENPNSNLQPNHHEDLAGQSAKEHRSDHHKEPETNLKSKKKQHGKITPVTSPLVAHQLQPAGHGLKRSASIGSGNTLGSGGGTNKDRKKRRLGESIRGLGVTLPTSGTDPTGVTVPSQSAQTPGSSSALKNQQASTIPILRATPLQTSLRLPPRPGSARKPAADETPNGLQHSRPLSPDGGSVVSKKPSASVGAELLAKNDEQDKVDDSKKQLQSDSLAPTEPQQEGLNDDDAEPGEQRESARKPIKYPRVEVVNRKFPAPPIWVLRAKDPSASADVTEGLIAAFNRELELRAPPRSVTEDALEEDEKDEEKDEMQGSGGEGIEENSVVDELIDSQQQLKRQLTAAQAFSAAATCLEPDTFTDALQALTLGADKLHQLEAQQRKGPSTGQWNTQQQTDSVNISALSKAILAPGVLNRGGRLNMKREVVIGSELTRKDRLLRLLNFRSSREEPKLLNTIQTALSLLIRFENPIQLPPPVVNNFVNKDSLRNEAVGGLAKGLSKNGSLLRNALQRQGSGTGAGLLLLLKDNKPLQSSSKAGASSAGGGAGGASSFPGETAAQSAAIGGTSQKHNGAGKPSKLSGKEAEGMKIKELKPARGYVSFNSLLKSELFSFSTKTPKLEQKLLQQASKMDAFIEKSKYKR